jgi:hypothetical protein
MIPEHRARMIVTGFVPSCVSSKAAQALHEAIKTHIRDAERLAELKGIKIALVDRVQARNILTKAMQRGVKVRSGQRGPNKTKEQWIISRLRNLHAQLVQEMGSGDAHVKATQRLISKWELRLRLLRREKKETFAQRVRRIKRAVERRAQYNMDKEVDLSCRLK